MKSKLWCLIAFIPGLSFLLFLVYRAGNNPYGERRYTLFDDATISMTFARTFVHTKELVWFPGAPRVQGFTNPLWTLYMAFVQFLGFENSRGALVVSLTGVLIIMLISFVVFRIIASIQPRLSHWQAILIAASIPFIYPLAFWTLRGMEVGLLALLALFLFLPVINENSKISWGLALLAIVLGG